MGSVNVTIRLDEDLRKEANILFNDMGISLNQAITLFVTQSVREQRIPFSIRKFIPTNDTLEAINEVEQMEKNPSKYQGYESVDDLFNDTLK